MANRYEVARQIELIKRHLRQLERLKTKFLECGCFRRVLLVRKRIKDAQQDLNTLVGTSVGGTPTLPPEIITMILASTPGVTAMRAARCSTTFRDIVYQTPQIQRNIVFDRWFLGPLHAAHNTVVRMLPVVDTNKVLVWALESTKEKKEKTFLIEWEQLHDVDKTGWTEIASMDHDVTICHYARREYVYHKAMMSNKWIKTQIVTGATCFVSLVEVMLAIVGNNASSKQCQDVIDRHTIASEHIESVFPAGPDHIGLYVGMPWNGSSVVITNLKTNTETLEFENDDEKTGYFLPTTAHNGSVIVAPRKGHIVIYDRESHRMRRISDEQWIHSVAFSPKGDLYVNSFTKPGGSQ